MNDTTDTITTNYEICREIGSGSFGVVYRVKNKSNMGVYALKSTRIRNTKTLHHCEYKVLGAFDHENIIKMIDHVETSTHIYTILEYGGENLAEWRARKSLNKGVETPFLYDIFCGIARALNYIHNCGYIYCDLKPANVLVDGASVKLCDMGAVVAFNENPKKCSYAFTRDYMSPEMVKKSIITYAHDTWSLGVLIIYLHVGANPFKGDCDDITNERILTHEPCLDQIYNTAAKFNTNFALDLHSYVAQLIQKNATSRAAIDAQKLQLCL